MYLRPKTYLPHVSLFFLTMLASAAPPAAPTFNKDILPILQTRCQPCHRPGELGPMPLVTYEQTRPWAKAIADSVKSGKMPPWFSDRCCGQFSPEHSLKPEEIAAIDAWAAAGALEGKKKDAPRPIQWTNYWKIDGPSLVISIPRPFDVPANAKLDTQYVILPIDLAEDKWASAAEIRPGDRSVVDYAVLYVRAKSSTWLRNIPKLTMSPGDPAPLNDPATEILAIYTPGSPASIWPEGMGKRLPAGSDLVLQIHYTSKKMPALDRTAIGIDFLKERPARRVLTFQMQNRNIALPPGAPDYRAYASGIVPHDALLVGMFPEMHLRGAAFEFAIAEPDGSRETILLVKPYDSAWQQSYPLKTPRFVPKGTKFLWIADFDNSAQNPHNPDPKAEVRWGDQNWQEKMAGFFDLAVDSNIERITFVSTTAP